MRNVLQVMDYAAPYRGSFIESLDSLDKELRKEGACLLYVFPPRAKTNAAAKWIAEMAAAGSRVFFLSGQLSKDVALLRRIIRDNDVGIVHTHFENFLIDLSVYLATLFSPVKRVRHFRNHFQHGATLKKGIKKIVLRNCDFVCVSESVSAGVRREFPRNKCYSVDNAIQYSRLDSFEQLKRVDFGIAHDSLVCFMMGFDFRRKGVDLAIDAIAALRRRVDARLVISVSSNLEAVKASIQQQLGSLPDWIVLVPPRNDVASYYRMADVFISASREEGFCNALVEAAYCERIVVASSIPAQGDLKIPHALWFEPGNARDLEARLVEALEKKGRVDAELRQAKAAVEQTYDVKAWAEKVVAIYEAAGVGGAPRRAGRVQPIG